MYVMRQRVPVLSFFGPWGHGWYDPGQTQGARGLAMGPLCLGRSPWVLCAREAPRGSVCLGRSPCVLCAQDAPRGSVCLGCSLWVLVPGTFLVGPLCLGLWVLSAWDIPCGSLVPRMLPVGPPCPASHGSVRSAKYWVGSGAVASSTDFIPIFLPRPGISSACQCFLPTETAKGRSFLCIFSQEQPLFLFLGVSERMGDMPR